MRIIKKPAERKAEILDAAEALFATKGYVKTSVADLLDAVGIAKGTFYYHFKSKEEVMDSVVMRFVGAGIESAQSIAKDSKLTATEKLFQLITSGSANESHKEHLIEQLHETNNAEMHLKSLVETILGLAPILADIIHQGVEEKSFSTPYPRESAEFLLVSSQFLLDAGLFHWKPEEIEQKTKAFSYLMETTLGAKSGTFNYVYDRLSNNK